mmetsp:Transcript_13145/g.21545  ORF Transcript_13145/g.21545 Transcript_13145/m.21545 type:complete len:89 (+) Transcript_13145:955-1221(+)
MGTTPILHITDHQGVAVLAHQRMPTIRMGKTHTSPRPPTTTTTIMPHAIASSARTQPTLLIAALCSPVAASVVEISGTCLRTAPSSAP